MTERAWRPGLMALSVWMLLVGAGLAAAQNPSVTAATPSSGTQDTIALVVKISGKNFAPGAKSNFFLSGTTSPDGITVKNTTFVNATEVDAVIDIAPTASLASFDIKVTNTSGRSGKGSDLFHVVEKVTGPAASCTVTPLDTTRFQLVRTLNPVVNGGSLYKTALGVGLTARRATLAYAAGSREVIVLAAGTNAATPGKIEVFFIDPLRGDLLDGTPIVPGGPVQPHVSIDVAAISSSFGPQQLAMGDVNADGVPDIVASQWTGQGYVALAVGRRAADGVVTYGLTSLPPPTEAHRFGVSVAMGDIDDDGFDEIAVSKGWYSQGKKVEFPKLLIYGAPSGVPSLIQTVAPLQVQSSSDFSYGNHVRIGDLNGDGLPDLAVGVPKWLTAGQRDAGAVFVHVSTGARPLMAQTTPVVLLSPAPQAGGTFGGHVAVGELTGDVGAQADLLTLDLAGGAEPTGDVFAGPLMADSQPSTPTLRISPEAGLTAGWATTGAAVADLTGDGLSDVVVGAPNTSTAGCQNSIGTTYVFVAQGTAATGTTGWTRYYIQPPTVDPDFGGFGWTAVTVPGSALIFIGDNGRNVGSVTGAGQVFVFKMLAP